MLVAPLCEQSITAFVSQSYFVLLNVDKCFISMHGILKGKALYFLQAGFTVSRLLLYLECYTVACFCSSDEQTIDANACKQM